MSEMNLFDIKPNTKAVTVTSNELDVFFSEKARNYFSYCKSITDVCDKLIDSELHTLNSSLDDIALMELYQVFNQCSKKDAVYVVELQDRHSMLLEIRNLATWELDYRKNCVNPPFKSDKFQELQKLLEGIPEGWDIGSPRTLYTKLPVLSITNDGNLVVGASSGISQRFFEKSFDYLEARHNFIMIKMDFGRIFFSR